MSPQLSTQLGISSSLVFTIFREHLGFSKASARCVPRCVSTCDPQHWLQSSRDLELFNADPSALIVCLVAGDETWLHHWTTVPQSFRIPMESLLTVPHKLQLQMKVMPTSCKKLRQAMKDKHRRMLTKGVLLLQWYWRLEGQLEQAHWKSMDTIYWKEYTKIISSTCWTIVSSSFREPLECLSSFISYDNL